MELVRQISKNLRRHKAKIATAESCTAGCISKLLTSIPGSSDYFEGSLVVYSNKAKISVLGVDEGLIDTYTEVSGQVACAMAERVKELMDTEYSIATTGYADYNGYGTEENPAGTIYVAISTPKETTVKRLELNHSREKNTHLATIAGLEMIQEATKSLRVVKL
jgi:PncC family amidohydrolase